MGISYAYSMIFPGARPVSFYSNVPFKFSVVDLRNINNWGDTKTLPDSNAYVPLVLVGTPRKIDNVDVQPLCPYCEMKAETSFEDQDTYYCTNGCDTFREFGMPEPDFQIGATFRINFDGARK